MTHEEDDRETQELQKLIDAYNAGDESARNELLGRTRDILCRVAHNKRRGREYITGTDSIIGYLHLEMIKRWEYFWSQQNHLNRPISSPNEFYARSSEFISYVIRKLVREIRGRNGHRPQVTTMGDNEFAICNASVDLEMVDLLETLESIEPRLKEIFLLELVHQMSPSQIAKSQGIAERTVVNRLGLARSAIRNILRNDPKI